MIWIVLAILLAALLFFIKPVTRTSRWMQVQTVDRDGRVISSERVRIKEPDRYEADGASHLRGYIEALLASKADFTSLLAFTTDGMRGLGIHKREDDMDLGLHFDRRREPEREEKARTFFRQRGIEPSQDYLAGNGGVPDATRVLPWPLEGDAEAVAAMCRTVLTELCGVTPEEGLDITYEEHEDRSAT